MFGLFNIPFTDPNNFIFFANGNSSWQTWSKPSNCKFVSFFLIGGGAGGGGGGAAAAGSSKTGGAGGGSSSIAYITYFAHLLPDTLYIQVGQGGEGGAGRSGTAGSGTAGSSGSLSYVSLVPDNTTLINILMKSGIVAATGGNGGLSTSTASTAGVGGTAFNGSGLLFYQVAFTSAVAGKNGTSGTTGGGSALTVNATPYLPLTGGTGGGGTLTSTPSAGGNINAFAFLPTMPGGAASGVAGGGGYSSFNFTNDVGSKHPLFFTGGTGGGGNNTTSQNGGDGGNGAYGCGGGGGGAGVATTGFGGGRGGKGGDGLVIITVS